MTTEHYHTDKQALSAAPAAAWANPHAALAATFIPGQLWQYRPRHDPTWTNTRTPNWLPEFEYRRHPDEAASPTPPAEQQAEPDTVYVEFPRSVGDYKYGGGLYTDAQMRDFADRTHALRMQAAPKAAAGEAVGIPHDKLAELHEGLAAAMQDGPARNLHIETAAALRKTAPQPTPAPLSDDVVKNAARYRWLREGNDAKHGVAWHVAVNLYGFEWDAAIDAALAAQGGSNAE